MWPQFIFRVSGVSVQRGLVPVRPQGPPPTGCIGPAKLGSFVACSVAPLPHEVLVQVTQATHAEGLCKPTRGRTRVCVGVCTRGCVGWRDPRVCVCGCVTRPRVCLWVSARV